MGEFNNIMFGAAIRSARLKAGMTCAALGRVVGTSKGSISRIERGHRPDLPNLIGLLDWLGLPLSFFTTGQLEALPPGTLRRCGIARREMELRGFVPTLKPREPAPRVPKPRAGRTEAHKAIRAGHSQIAKDRAEVARRFVSAAGGRAACRG